MENYKEKYERLTQFIKDLYPHMSDYCKEKTEGMIPELKESEDERIRKALLNEFIHLQSKGYKFAGLEGEEIIAWLEKQGKKVDAIENFNTEFERQISHLIASTINKEHEYNEGFVKWTANALLNYAKHELEKQGEQKIELAPIFKIGDILKRKGKDYTFRVDRIQGGYYHCDRNHGAFFPIEEQGNWELVEQKPVEWSEKDEKMFKSVISSIQISRSSCEEDDDVRDLFDNEIDWLKSLKDRYTWKPSDGQIKQLGWVAEQNKDNMIGKELMSLYNDLKKLREE